MKRLICSAAVASVLLGASVIPSGATTVIGTDATFTSAGSFDNPVGFILTSSENVDIAGSTTTLIPSLSVSLSDVPTTLPYPESIPVISGVWNETFTLAAGTYSVLFAGTSPTGTSGYSGQITISAVPIPGALVLFASGLGLLGFLGWNKKRKAGSGSASLEAVAC